MGDRTYAKFGVVASSIMLAMGWFLNSIWISGFSVGCLGLFLIWFGHEIAKFDTKGRDIPAFGKNSYMSGILFIAFVLAVLSARHFLYVYSQPNESEKVHLANLNERLVELEKHLRFPGKDKIDPKPKKASSLIEASLSPPNAPKEDDSKCEYKMSTDYPRGDLSDDGIQVSSLAHCCTECISRPNCVAFTMSKQTMICWLKSSLTDPKYAVRHDSGYVVERVS
ncbi:hypothetical protein AAMO2058_001323000 [Amorphochlora amoebiformis]